MSLPLLHLRRHRHRQQQQQRGDNKSVLKNNTATSAIVLYQKIRANKKRVNELSFL